MMHKHIFTLSIVALLMGGCSLSPELSIPKSEFPERYEALSSASSSASLMQWWKAYGDEKLSALIEEALANNYDLQSSMANISLARATLSSATSNRYPSLDAEGSGRKYRSSADTFNSTSHNTYNNFGLSAVLSYELDLWGKYKEAEASAKSSLIATYAAKETVKIALIASVAEGYFTLISLNEQLDIVKETIVAREEGLKRYAVQYKAGSITKATLLQEEAELRSAQINKDSLEQSIVTQQSALAVLVGKSPKEIAEFAQTSLPRVLPNDIVVPSNLPSELLQNRPDIKQAEENLKATNANIGVARAAYFPSISLSGVLGYESTQLSNLVSSRSAMHNFGGSVASPLFNMGKTSSSVESAKANKEIAEISYAQTVQKAFQESYDALNTRHILITKLEHQKAYLDSMAQVFVLTKRQYEAGYGDYLALLDAKRNYLSAQLALIQVKQELLSSGVSLYKALGGGFDKEHFKEETSAL